jgi:maleylpyruvate isomerase
MGPPLDAVASAHRRLEELLGGLTDAQVLAPSLLPHWTRGHVLAHVADNARAFARVTERALQSRPSPFHPGGQVERDAHVEAMSTASADELRELVGQCNRDLEAVWSTVGDSDWSRPVLFHHSDLSFAVLARWREAWIHMVDLDLGLTPRQWPLDFAIHTVDFLLGRLPDGVDLASTDAAAHWQSGGLDEKASTVNGHTRDLAAWLAGRASTEALTITGPVPRLGPWPPEPEPSTG